MKLLVFLYLAASSTAAATTSNPTATASSSTHSLSYEAVVAPHVIVINENEIVPYSMFTKLATQIATDIIQLHSDSQIPTNRKLELDNDATKP